MGKSFHFYYANWLNNNYKNPLDDYLINGYLWNFNKFFIIIDIIVLYLLQFNFLFLFIGLLSFLKILMGFLIFVKILSHNEVNISQGSWSFFENYTSLIHDLCKILYYGYVVFFFVFTQKNSIVCINYLLFLFYLGSTNFTNIYFLKKYQLIYLMENFELMEEISMV
jgi:hypothetical protein